MDLKELPQQFVRSPEKNKPWIIGLSVCMLLVLFLSFRSIVMILSVQGDAALEDVVPKPIAPDAPDTRVKPLTYTVELKEVAVHVMSEDGKRMAYAQFTLLLDCPTRRSLAKVESMRSVILNHIFDAANGFTLEQLSTAQGKDAFKSQLVRVFGQELGSLGPSQVLIQNWVMG